MATKFRFRDSFCSLCQRTRSKPLGFVDGRRNLSNNTTIKSKFPDSNGIASVRCYTGFNLFVNSSSERKVPHKGPWEKLHVRTVFGEHPQEFSRQGVQNLECSVPTSDAEDDDFVELNYPLPKSGDITSKLLTAKQRSHTEGNDFTELDHPLPKSRDITSKLLTAKRSLKTFQIRKKAKPPRKLSNAGASTQHVTSWMRSFPRENSGLKIPTKPENHLSDLHCTSEETKDKTEKDNHVLEKKETQKSLKYFVIEKVPLGISLLQLTEAVSVYGEVSKAFMRTCNSAFSSCHIEFKSIESSERAAAAQWITCNCYRLPIHANHDPGTGPDSTSMADSRLWVGPQICNILGGISKQLNMKRIYLEDLEDLHNAVVHLRDLHNDTHQ